ncbi:MAG: hypothetical protein VYB88_11480 [Pseudomonadota bacterium]|uniref:hypothetical protein n=1 Tax=Ralstonia pickettii TaxID=329 RepID=UPI002714C948|nr:hypothetical protein [Ralstonia pickettii]MEE2978086.1 hypothetical protein [Pseudomonadota bacterium]WKZ86001.1 hypothetical protein N5B55_03335 [Ralstonia pickettii]
MIACAVAVAAHLAFLHAVSAWKPQTAPEEGHAGTRLLYVGLSPELTGKGTGANGQRSGEVGSAALSPLRGASPVKPNANVFGSAGYRSELSAPESSRSENLDGMRFYASTEVDRQALPASSLELLDVMALVENASPITLRVYISVDGVVVRAEIVRANEDNRPAAARLALILMETRFVPAKRLGADVAAVRELEFQIQPSIGSNRPASS